MITTYRNADRRKAALNAWRQLRRLCDDLDAEPGSLTICRDVGDGFEHQVDSGPLCPCNPVTIEVTARTKAIDVIRAIEAHERPQ